LTFPQRESTPPGWRKGVHLKLADRISSVPEVSRFPREAFGFFLFALIRCPNFVRKSIKTEQNQPRNRSEIVDGLISRHQEFKMSGGSYLSGVSEEETPKSVYDTITD
jgi:hypothetical protein